MSKRSAAYIEGVRATIPDDLPDGAWLAMMEERGLDPLDDDTERPACRKYLETRAERQQRMKAKKHTEERKP